MVEDRKVYDLVDIIDGRAENNWNRGKDQRLEDQGITFLVFRPVSFELLFDQPFIEP